MDVTILENDILVTIVDDNTIVASIISNNQPGQAAILFKDEGLDLGTQGTATIVNFVGAGVVASRSGATITVTISSSGGGGSGHTIQENGTSFTQRTNLNFEGAVITDDSANDATVINNVGENLFLYYNFY